MNGQKQVIQHVHCVEKNLHFQMKVLVVDYYLEKNDVQQNDAQKKDVRENDVRENDVQENDVHRTIFLTLKIGFLNLIPKA